MNILIATGIFEPEVGGPATYTPRLARSLTERGHEVTVVTFSPADAGGGTSRYAQQDAQYSFRLVRIPRHGPSRIPGKRQFVSYWRLFRWLRRSVGGYDIAYALSWVAVGGPLMIAATLRRVPYVVRVGGGYIWEKYLDEGKPPMPLRDFYAYRLYRRYPATFFLIKRVFQNARHIVFNSDQQRTLFQEHYRLRPRQVSTIYNPTPRIEIDARRDIRRPDKEIVFAGRLIVMKNVATLLRAFAQMSDTSYTLRIIGDGPQRARLERIAETLGVRGRVSFEDPMPRDELYRSIINCAFLVLPSWTDISPNQVPECLALGIPFLLTKEHFLPIDTRDVLTIDPRSIEDVTDKMERLCDPDTYVAHLRHLQKLSIGHSWRSVTEEHERLFREIVSE